MGFSADDSFDERTRAEEGFGGVAVEAGGGVELGVSEETGGGGGGLREGGPDGFFVAAAEEMVLVGGRWRRDERVELQDLSEGSVIDLCAFLCVMHWGGDETSYAGRRPCERAFQPVCEAAAEHAGGVFAMSKPRGCGSLEF